jgi:hypothetical protein
MNSFVTVFLTKYYMTDQIKEGEMGRAYGMYERSEMHTGLWWGKFQGKQPLRRPRCRWEITVKVNLKHFHTKFCPPPPIHTHTHTHKEGLCSIKLVGS